MKNHIHPILGAIVGDIVGSVYEWHNIKTKSFPLFSGKGFFTDDTVMTLAVAKAVEKALRGGDLAVYTENAMRELGNKYPHAGYGGRFAHWLTDKDAHAYGSFGNGSAMRVSPCGTFADTLEEALQKAKITASVTHDHPEGIKGAQAVAAAIFLALHGSTIEEIRRYITSEFYDLDFTLDAIRPVYRFDETCQGSVPQAIEAFLESTDFEDAVRNAVSIGGDSDTIAAITGSIAGAYYGVPEEIGKKALTYLSKELRGIYDSAAASAKTYDEAGNGGKSDKAASFTEMVFILDRSGSMSGLEKDTIGGYNGLLNKQRAEPGKAVVTTVLFDDKYDMPYDAVDIEKIPDMTDKVYFARGMTALLDAIGKTVTSVKARQAALPKEERPDKTVVVIITDGEENASREYNGKSVRALVEERKAEGWEFLFLGANIDAIATANNFGIDADRSVTYRADSIGTRTNFEAVSNFMCFARAAKSMAAPMGAEWKRDIEARSKDKRNDH